jgi:hypothetical protein|eukprot:COSAG01_NODE_11498_length_1921_cov_4.789243_3_plen_82_part_00
MYDFYCPSQPLPLLQIEPSVPGFLPMNIALVTLQCLHVFWFVLILKAVKKFVDGGSTPDDVREHDDDRGNGSHEDTQKKAS